jgi:hypothetical protein
MPLPRQFKQHLDQLDETESAIGDVQTALDALPATPLEADLPDIVQIVADLKTITSDLNTTLAAFINLIKTVRVNQ